MKWRYIGFQLSFGRTQGLLWVVHPVLLLRRKKGRWWERQDIAWGVLKVRIGVGWELYNATFHG